MKRSIILALAVAAAAQNAVGKPVSNQQTPLGAQMDSYDFASALKGPGASAAESLADFAISSLSQAQQEELVVKLWEQLDVVDAMKMAGHGEGLDDMVIIQVFGEDKPRSVTEGDKLRLKKAGYDFMDITDHPDLGKLNAQRVVAQRAPLVVGATERVRSSIKAMTDDLDDAHLRADIAKLSSFWNRNYRSPWGLLSSNWIYSQAEELLKQTDGSKLNTSISKFHHHFLQNSVIARIEAADSSVKDKEIILVSAHQDSLNYKLPFYRAPGADDDGSGSVTILQVLRSLVEEKFTPPPHIALEFHWFAGEEGGLLGSQDVAASYEKAGKKIKGMLHMDMTAYVREGTEPIIGFFESNVDKNTTTFATQLVDEYLPLKWNMTGCGQSCGSDHMSFNKAGYPVAFATESLFEDGPHEVIHSAHDDFNPLFGEYSFEHMLQFVKLGIAFVVELAAQP